MFGLTIKTSFAAAHFLRNYRGKCANLHGHTWHLQVDISGEELNPLGMLLDFSQLKEYVHEFLQELDHSCLNELPAFCTQAGDMANPTAENIARYLFLKLKTKLQTIEPAITLQKVHVWESPNACATYWEE